jgi:hypothetical protein
MSTAPAPRNPRRIEGTNAVEIQATSMTTTPQGDGFYPVFAEVENGKVVSLRIDLRTPSS